MKSINPYIQGSQVSSGIVSCCYMSGHHQQNSQCLNNIKIVYSFFLLACGKDKKTLIILNATDRQSPVHGVVVSGYIVLVVIDVVAPKIDC